MPDDPYACPKSPNGQHEPADYALSDPDGDAPLVKCKHCNCMLG